MNEARGPLNNRSSRLDFPSIVSSEALQRQAFYDPSGGDRPTQGTSTNVEALANLVQELNQQNHELLSRVAALDAELTQHRQTLNRPAPEPPSFVASDYQGDYPGTLDETTQEQVAHLLNHLEFTQQANQRQSIRIESLSVQLEDSQNRISQLEAENQELQQRCSDRLCRLNQLDEECRDLRLRLQRQQQYTLQFKAALEKCLEVPPPSYSYVDGTGDFTLAAAPPEPEAPAMVEPVSLPDDGIADDDINWFVQPLFPKVQQIQSWATVQQERRRKQSQPINKQPEYASSLVEEHNGDVPHPRLPQEQIPEHPTPTPAVFRNFPKPRFQSTLLNLAYGHETVSPPGFNHQALEMPNFESTQSLMAKDLAVETPPSSDSAGQNIVEARGLEPKQKPYTQAEALSESQPASLSPPTLADQKAPEAVAPSPEFGKSDSGEIPPFPAESPLFGPMDATDDKLWQSLVNLIDLSAADGLNLPPNTPTALEGVGQGETDWEPQLAPQSAISPRLTDSVPSPLVAEVSAGSNAEPVTDVAPAIATDHSSPPPNPQPSGLATDETSGEAPSAPVAKRSKVSHRSIDLPSFPRIAVPSAASSSNSTSA
ncbi:MAG: hypothetical protein VKJ64_09995 [Leptolyngbyaceae bacterium]|nr:hypothetical protein [Leptolyngbyaceae bacterium]